MPPMFRYIAIGVLVIAIALVLIPSRPEITVSDITAKHNQFGPATVTANFHNSGGAMDVGYWIEKDRSAKRHCAGRVRLGDKERKAISFACAALSNFNGTFTLQTGAAE